ncbi:MAG: hypothetical protein E7102_02180 [Prevotella ruminicola]|uniref:BT4734-like N-terminal domain-containing protein n=1 Tax=Xylanibacter ruminicola TaxID=839 RepID=A0A928BRM9_XYLRU|nr:hypothetical protein [Xylanibacter ruminicola]
MGFCYQKNFSNPTLPVDEAQFWALVRATQWNENIDKYRESGDAALKRKLPAFIFQATFDDTTSKAGKTGAWRKQAATKLTGLVVMDIDHVENPLTLYQGWIEKGLDLKALGIVLIYITPSGKGIKIVFKARLDWGNLIDNQHAMGNVLNVVVDESCKDASRMSFICKESDILYIDKELFTYENKAFSERYTALYRDGHSQATKEVLASPIGIKPGDVSTTLDMTNGEIIKWHGYDVQGIIDARYADKLPCEADSNRHSESLKLATDLLLMLDSDKQLVQHIVEAQPWVQEIIASRNENVAQTVSSAADCVAQKEKKYACSLPSKAMQEAIQKATGKTFLEITKAQTQKTVTLKEDEMSQMLWDWGAQIEAMFDDFPILKDICKGLKRNQYPAALIVAGAFEMTLMTRCTYRFYHRPEELRRLNSSALIIGDPASGKSFATRLFKLLAAPIVAADKVGRDAINAYREQMRTKGANKEKPKKPKVVVRVHPARTSNAQFIQDMVNAVETVDGEEMHLHMLTFDTELDNTLSVQKGGSWIDKMSLELKAFHNEEDGQAYSNMDSILQDFNVYWNYVYTGTPIALKKKVNEQNFGSGLATRLTCIPLPATNFEMMSRESTVDYESDARIKAWAEKLDRMKGELTVQKIVDELYDWTARRMMDAAENNSRADEMLLKRCAYHGLNYAAPFIVMRHWDKIKQDGDYWCGEFETDEIDWRLTELIVNMQFACQRHYFGAMAEAYFDNKLKDASVNVQRRQKTFEAFARLPEEFTNEDVMRCFNLSSESSARSKTSRLLRDHLIVKVREEKGATKALFSKTGTIIL